MEGQFKQCPNGHYYQGATCPYCKGNGANQPTQGNSTSAETKLYDQGGMGASTSAPTLPLDGNQATQVYNPNHNGNGGGNNPGVPANKTVFINEDAGTTTNDNGHIVEAPKYRPTRRLVGWLVSYSLDKMGVDFRLYEGRNIIGRDMDCNITVNDNMVSSKHAVLLFRADKYSLTDQQSTHGTFVNGNDIDLEPCYLQDGDVIKVGETVFKFRTSF